jgi:hypothetical protein
MALTMKKGKSSESEKEDSSGCVRKDICLSV